MSLLPIKSHISIHINQSNSRYKIKNKLKFDASASTVWMNDFSFESSQIWQKYTNMFKKIHGSLMKELQGEKF